MVRCGCHPRLMGSFIKGKTALLPVIFLLAGCGLSVPRMQPFSSAKDDAVDEGLAESSLIGYVKCELRRSVQNALAQDAEDKAYAEKHNTPDHPRIDWLRKWGAQVNMKITVDEKSVLAPGLSLNSPMRNVVSTFSSGGNVSSSQSFSLGLGASLTADATRVETVAFYFPFEELLIGTTRLPDTMCNKAARATIESDLKISDFLQSKLLIVEDPGLLLYKPGVKKDGRASPFNALTYETSFIVSFSGNVTPTWKLIRVSANPTGQLFTGSRMRTDDLTITMGEAVFNDQTKALEPSSAAHDQNLATLIGQAVASSLRNSQ